ncbi:MAG: hypothetical protein JWQ16_2499 [Novosphingobium sp.]|nr:hypothetical protein [Novosphingobium sp.]
MGVHSNIIQDPGSTSIDLMVQLAIPAANRPTSFSDAIAQYRAAKLAEFGAQVLHDDDVSDAAVSRSHNCMFAVLEAPVTSIRDFALAFAIAHEEGAGTIEQEQADLLLESLKTLASAQIAH